MLQVPFSERVYCDMEDQPLPWNIKQEIEGPNGQFIAHIVKMTQARVICDTLSRSQLKMFTYGELDAFFVHVLLFSTVITRVSFARNVYLTPLALLYLPHLRDDIIRLPRSHHRV